MKFRIFLAAAALLFAPRAFAEHPRLVINIVVGSMRAEDLDRYKPNFEAGGLQRLMLDGTYYPNSHYNYHLTTTPVSLATLSTGAMPSTHGIIGNHWVDYTTNEFITLIDEKDPKTDHIIAPTLSEALMRHNADSKSVTIACDASSAFLMSGRRGGEVFWIDGNCAWQYRSSRGLPMPKWIIRHNSDKMTETYIMPKWTTAIDHKKYINRRSFDIVLSDNATKRRKEEIKGQQRLKLETDSERLRYTPAGNSAVIGLAKQALIQYDMGLDTAPDILNIVLDASRYITEAYGPESIEVEDMYYRLDQEVAELLKFINLQIKSKNIVITFTSAHGSSPSYDVSSADRKRFIARQFEVIVNGFLNVRYGTGDWVVGYDNKCLWLNHDLIYKRGLGLAQVQNEVATFAMQFSGVSHALSATAMRNSYFGSGYAQKMQNSFYPQRSGDVMINLMPEWIEESYRTASSAGSMYGYDTNVPLIFYGDLVPRAKVMRRVDQTSAAPTVARILGITPPAASEGEILDEMTNL